MIPGTVSEARRNSFRSRHVIQDSRVSYVPDSSPDRRSTRSGSGRGYIVPDSSCDGNSHVSDSSPDRRSTRSGSGRGYIVPDSSSEGSSYVPDTQDENSGINFKFRIKLYYNIKIENHVILKLELPVKFELF